MEVTTSSNDGDREVFSRAMAGDENALRAFVERYLRLLFGFILSYSNYSREQAFSITVRVFSKTLRDRARFGTENEFLEEALRRMLGECAETAPAGAPAENAPSLRIVREALLRLSPGEKAVLLLRDQCHLPFERISAVLGTGLREARSSCLTARESLRAGVKEILERPAGGAHAV